MFIEVIWKYHIFPYLALETCKDSQDYTALRTTDRFLNKMVMATKWIPCEHSAYAWPFWINQFCNIHCPKEAFFCDTVNYLWKLRIGYTHMSPSPPFAFTDKKERALFWDHIETCKNKSNQYRYVIKNCRNCGDASVRVVITGFRSYRRRNRYIHNGHVYSLFKG